MHILVGKYKNRRLLSTPSPKVRPTARRLREALFDLLGPRIEGSRFLDLCAGSGAVGIEALSRGAAHVTFVDRSARMHGFMELNLERCGVQKDHVQLCLADVMDFLRAAAAQRTEWDVAYLDPPYSTDHAPLLAMFGSGVALSSKSGVLVVEHHCEKRLEDRVGSLRRWRIITQGESCLSFYERK